MSNELAIRAIVDALRDTARATSAINANLQSLCDRQRKHDQAIKAHGERVAGAIEEAGHRIAEVLFAKTIESGLSHAFESNVVPLDTGAIILPLAPVRALAQALGHFPWGVEDEPISGGDLLEALDGSVEDFLLAVEERGTIVGIPRWDDSGAEGNDGGDA